MYYDIVHHIYVTSNQELAHEHELLSPIPALHEEKPHPELRNENYSIGTRVPRPGQDLAEWQMR